jgi:hypothetical protein
MTEITKKLQEAVNILDNIDIYDSGLNDRLSEIDLKIQDLLHYIETNKISILWAYKYICELKKLRLERREIKNDICIMQKFNEQKNKLLSTSNRKFLMAEIYKVEKQLHTPYKNRQYKDGEIDEILKKKA